MKRGLTEPPPQCNSLEEQGAGTVSRTHSLLLSQALPWPLSILEGPGWRRGLHCVSSLHPSAWDFLSA